MTESELPRPIKIKSIASEPYEISATADECRALAGRFGLPEVKRVHAVITLIRDGAAVSATGTLDADWTQSCAISGDDFPVSHRETIKLRFVPTRTDWRLDDEVELTADDCDELEYDGDTFDLGEAIAQSVGLGIDPYATGPNANAARKSKNIQTEGEQDGPLAELLAGLKRD